MLMWSSVNRNEQAFPCTHIRDMNRGKPSVHLSFGYGVHHCIGALLARAEARIAIKTLPARTKSIVLSPDSGFSHVPSFMVRSLKKLNLQIESV